MIKRDWDHLSDKIGYVLDMVEELHARDISNNCIHRDFHDVSWEELCDAVMEMLEEIKVGY